MNIVHKSPIIHQYLSELYMLFSLLFDYKSFRLSALLFLSFSLPILTPSPSSASTKFFPHHAFIKPSTLPPTNLNFLLSSTPKVRKSTLHLVKQYEGFRSRAYLDTNGLPVVGYGQSKISGKPVRLGQSISPTQAEAALIKELSHLQLLVQAHVRVPLTPNQLSALTSLVYNTGPGFLTRSTLIRKLNAGDYAGAAREFPRWNKAHLRGKLVPLPGLTKRRLAEQRLFLTP